MNPLLVVLAFVLLCLAHTVHLKAYGKECFFEPLKANDELAVTFQVGSRDPDEAEQQVADFYVKSPQGHVMFRINDVLHGDEVVRATTNGNYEFCFLNEKLNYAQKDVSFNVHGVVYIDVNDPNKDPLDYAIKKLSQMTMDVKNEQSYLVVRERTHRNTAESTNDRVKWWSIFQVVLVVSNLLFQIFYLRRFFEVKTGV